MPAARTVGEQEYDRRKRAMAGCKARPHLWRHPPPHTITTSQLQHDTPQLLMGFKHEWMAKMAAALDNMDAAATSISERQKLMLIVVYREHTSTSHTAKNLIQLQQYHGSQH